MMILKRHGALAVICLAFAFALSGPAFAQGANAAALRELRQIIETQQQQIAAQAQLLDRLQQRIEALDRTASRAEEQAERAVAAAGAGGAASVVSSGQERVSLTLSGQVNRGLLWADDGATSELFNVDNDNSSTRIRAAGLANVTGDVGLGAAIEVQFESNSTGTVTQAASSGVGPNTFTERKLEWYLDSKRFGRLWMGQGSTASDGVSESDLSDTGVIGYSEIADFAGGLLFRNSTTGALTTVSISNAFSQLDGLSRDDRVRYDTPRFNGLQFSTSALADDRYDAALTYAAEYDRAKVAAAIGYAHPSTANTGSRLSGSASVLWNNGFNVTLAAGQDDPETAARSDPKFWYTKLGYIANIFPIGTTAFAVDYSQADDIAQNRDEFSTYGAFVVQNLADFGTQFYLGVRNHDLDRPGTPTDEIFAVLGGARVKF